MLKSNLHTHSLYCDGKAPLNTYLENAIDLGFDSLGFSSHAPLPFKNSWAMKSYNLKGYFDEIADLKKTYSGKIQLYTGLEADYIKDKAYPSSLKTKHHEIDYLIGSVHFLKIDTLKTYIEIDGSHTRFLKAVKSIGIKTLVKQYYEATREMINYQSIDIVGHIDKIKIQNRRTSLFKETEKWYVNEIEKTLDILRNTPIIMEINTRGIYKQLTTEPYPSWWIIKKAIEKGIRLTINSDTHHPKELQMGFKETLNELKKLNCEGLYFLKNGQWIKEPM